MQTVRFQTQSTVFLHGFPGVQSRQNRDIAQRLAETTGREAVALLYSGMGIAPGVFGFRSCADEVDRYFQQRTQSEPQVQFDLVGHSWGGYLALRTIELHPSRIRRLVLMSPLLEMPPFDRAMEMLEETARQNPQIWPNRVEGDFQRLADEFAQGAHTLTPLRLIGEIPGTVDVLFLQAKEDDVTPTPTATAALSKFRTPPRFELVDTDHSFLGNRGKITDLILDFLS